ncbi:MAG: DUF134 domain-containing protein [Deltaproteobacteria bacterium]|nr:DUF134 domain-containing protein [Deltaproteobacteria bacterium]
MVRPPKSRLVVVDPKSDYFKPRGIPMVDLEEVQLTVDGLEALRLADFEGMSHEQAGVLMGVSRATFGRIVEQARRAVADALIHGKAIHVEGGHYRRVDPSAGRPFFCDGCRHRWFEPPATGRPEKCPACGSEHFHRMGKRG